MNGYINLTSSLASKIIVILGGLFFNAIISNLYNSEDIGTYFFCLNMANIVSVFICFGANKYIVRTVAIQKQDEKKCTADIAISSTILFLIASTSSSIIVSIFLFALNLKALFYSIIWGALLTWQLFGAEFYRGKGNILVASFLSGSLSVIIYLVIIYVFKHYFDGNSIFWAINIILFAISICLFIFVTPQIIKYCKFFKKVNLEDFRFLFKGLTPIFISNVTIIMLTQFDVVALYFASTKEQAAIYGLSVRVAALASAPLILLNSVIQHRVAKLYFSQKIDKLQFLLSSSTSTSFFASIVIALFMAFSIIWWGEPYFGENLEKAKPIFLILLAANIANCYSGSAGVALIMSGYFHLFMRCTLVGGGLILVAGIPCAMLGGARAMAVLVMLAVFFTNILYIKNTRSKIAQIKLSVGYLLPHRLKQLINEIGK